MTNLCISNNKRTYNWPGLCSFGNPQVLGVIVILPDQRVPVGACNCQDILSELTGTRAEKPAGTKPLGAIKLCTPHNSRYLLFGFVCWRLFGLDYYRLFEILHLVLTIAIRHTDFSISARVSFQGEAEHVIQPPPPVENLAVVHEPARISLYVPARPLQLSTAKGCLTWATWSLVLRIRRPYLRTLEVRFGTPESGRSFHFHSTHSSICNFIS